MTDLVHLLPSQAGTSCEIKSDFLPNLSCKISTGSIVVRKAHHDYENFYRAECLEFYLSPFDCRRLALAVLSVVMHSSSGFRLDFLHPQSQIKSFRIARPGSQLRNLGYTYIGTSYIYSPDLLKNLVCDAKVGDKPVFKLCSEVPVINLCEWHLRNVVELDVSELGALLLVKMLLDLGGDCAGCTELELGSLSGNSVGPGSAEARFWLPGSIAWESRYQVSNHSQATPPNTSVST